MGAAALGTLPRRRFQHLKEQAANPYKLQCSASSGKELLCIAYFSNPRASLPFSQMTPDGDDQNTKTRKNKIKK